MKKMPALSIAIALLLCTSTSKAECVIKESPAIPDGATATAQQMEEAQKVVKDYIAVTQEYLACLEFEGKGKPNGPWTILYNQQTEKMERLASDFNKQLKAFKSK